jgi:starvation-inducible DNA-binding protein
MEIELVMSLRIALANTFLMYFKAHSHHWNVEGIHFSQLHSFFGDLYSELHDASDLLAEEIRSLKAYAPKTLSEMYQFKTVNEGVVADTPEEMLQDLLITNDQVIESLNKSIELATKLNKQGLLNSLPERVDVHNKHGWMIRSHLK